MRALIFAFICFLAATQALGALPEPKFGYDYVHSSGRAVQGDLKYIVGIEGVMDDCSQAIAVVRIEKLDYVGASTMIRGFRAELPEHKRAYFALSRALYQTSEANKGNVAALFVEGAVLTLVYQSCGNSGSSNSVRDVFLKSKPKPSRR